MRTDIVTMVLGDILLLAGILLAVTSGLTTGAVALLVAGGVLSVAGALMLARGVAARRRMGDDKVGL